MLKPLSKRVVLVKIKEDEKKTGGLLLPGAQKSAENIAKVVAVADDVSEVSVGDTVVFEQYEGPAVEHDGQEQLIVELHHIAAIVK